MKKQLNFFRTKLSKVIGNKKAWWKNKMLLIPALMIMARCCFAEDYMAGGMTDVDDNFGPNSTMAHYVYGAGAFIGFVWWAIVRNWQTFASIPAIPVAFYAIWKYVVMRGIS